MKVIPVPSALEERTFDPLVQAVHEADGDGRMLLDARRVRWVDPYGVTGLLAVGGALAASGDRPVLQLPQSSEVRSYLGRIGFFDQAGSVFEFHGASGRDARTGASDVLLEITPIRSHGDIHTVVDRVQERTVILARQLNYPTPWAVQFSIILSEVCQNIIEHSEADGWVASQIYHWKRRLGRKVAVIGVVDLGIGFKGSLAAEHAARFGDRWGDAAALEAAFIHGLTRFHDRGRGQGLQQIRKQVGRFGGKISIRSGTARIADVQDWDDALPLAERLPRFPGSQICIVLPERVEETGGAS